MDHQQVDGIMPLQYKGCSVQSVPSWSKVAMRSAGSTYLVLDLSVVSFTKARTMSFAGPLFQDGKGSLWAWPVAVARSLRRRRAAAPAETNARRVTFLAELFMESFMQPSIFLSDFVPGPDAVHRWHCQMEDDDGFSARHARRATGKCDRCHPVPDNNLNLPMAESARSPPAHYLPGNWLI